jgi:telomerase reverse transcriptase
MMYIFPRQFGLHNVFTSTVNRQQTAQKFQDYTLREEEIKSKFPPREAGAKSHRHVPKRLRGKTMHLVQRLQVLHARCSYAEMLHHYCPVSGYGMAIRALLTHLGARTSWWPETNPGCFE